MFYKVVKSINRGLMSARSVSFEDYPNPKHIIHYRTQRWVKPKIPKSKIFVFDSLENARSFKDYNEHIYECEVRNPIKCSKIANLLHDIYSFWIWTWTSVSTSEPPKGTYICDAVKLIRRVK